MGHTMRIVLVSLVTLVGLAVGGVVDWIEEEEVEDDTRVRRAADPCPQETFLKAESCCSMPSLIPASVAEQCSPNKKKLAAEVNIPGPTIPKRIKKKKKKATTTPIPLKRRKRQDPAPPGEKKKKKVVASKADANLFCGLRAQNMLTADDDLDTDKVISILSSGQSAAVAEKVRNTVNTCKQSVNDAGYSNKKTKYKKSTIATGNCIRKSLTEGCTISSPDATCSEALSQLQSCIPVSKQKKEVKKSRRKNAKDIDK